MKMHRNESLRLITVAVLTCTVPCACEGQGTENDADTDGVEATDGESPSSSAGPGSSTGGDTETSGTASSGASDSDSDDSGPEPDVPHALGTIVLGETHLATGGTSTPFVTASFVPDAAAVAESCMQQIGECRVLMAPDCGPCGPSEYCAFDESCTATCQRYCDAPCGTGEVCYFPSPGQTGCKALESFDAGALTFTGTTSPITLFPPYTYTGQTGGAPFTPGAQLEVSASGATGAGFEAFERSFTGTSFVQSNLDTLRLHQLLGGDAGALTWVAGSDELELTATLVGSNGRTGTITCELDDASGSFTLPTAAISAALDGQTASTATLSLTRRRTTRHKDASTKGTLLDSVVQEIGWLDLATVSTETATLQTASCEECNIAANETSCAAQVAACEADQQCLDYYSCIYYEEPDCETQFPTGAQLLNALFACQCNVCAYECADFC
jgi:hypothetical protein